MSLESNIKPVLDLIIPSIKAQISTKANTSSPHSPHKGPVILGVTGLQGSGKSTWATSIVQILERDFNLRAINLSLDDLYKTHEELAALRETNPDNKLFRTRGQPGTHDEELAHDVFEVLHEHTGEGEVKIPVFDKSRFNGEGDRLPKNEWLSVSGQVDVVVFEGWCVGFQPLSDNEVSQRWRGAIETQASEPPTNESVNTLRDHKLEYLLELNRNLARYCDRFMGPQHFDFLIHLDTDDLRNVYTWRLQQEHALLAQKGTGMTNDEAVRFIQGYMPGYELYLDGLREGFFRSSNGRNDRKQQVRVVLDRDRRIGSVQVLQ